MAKKQTKSKANTSSKRGGWLRLILKLLLVAMIGLAAYLFYLDAQIKHSFTGNKWQVPAQIFARPLVISKGQEITPKEILDELKLLGYRSVSKADSSGEYHYQAGVLKLMRRGFQFADGNEPMRELVISWNGERIASIQDLGMQQDIGNVRLEPWLVTRMVSSSREDRMLLTLDEVPDLLPKALTLVEDKNFYDHHGVAPLSILRALMANIAAGRTVQGGSTLTQQLVKNLYLTRERSITRKVKEALMAILIDARYSKSEILQAYLNEVFLGQNGDMAVHGFGLASYFYFDRPANELNVPEIATLVAMIKGPSFYNPRRYPERVKERRDLVMRILFDANEITRQEYERYISTPLGLATDGRLASGQHPAFMDRVRRELSEILADPSLRDSGVKVFTTLDIYAQRRAELSVKETLAGLQSDRSVALESAMVVSDISSGEIRAIVGGKEIGFQGFNRALDAHRQVGSLIKPAVYLAALEDPTRFNLATPLQDNPITLKSTGGKLWSPQNADKQFRGQVPLVEAISHSLNVPTVNLGMQVGLDNIAHTIRQLGVESEFREVPALTLGAMSLTPVEINQMYQTLSNNGRYIPLHAVTAVVSANNRLLWKQAEYYSQRVDEAATYLLNYALYKVTTEGTAKRIGSTFPSVNMAGKTGTTDDYRDSWFSGFDRNNVITVWVGNDENQPVSLTGAGGALPVFIRYQQLQTPKSLSRRFPAALGIAHFDAMTGEVTVPGCPDSLSVPAILDVLPPPRQDCLGRPVESVPDTEQKKSWWKKLFGIKN
ncbi:penicillin-binding protein 1B [Alteromonas aestuariivivens]|uniref:Penicillin-binding protein 1B n=1 Tax=Alteromonas aestuariivivens TaxID=1938339 RepID=A0A3D8MAH1_9ALTE|nr:penicillin-binding protein 1B [Alteromonas aestuariivivens]RDV26735.1 penicillin-binding protein 1B [Alteromonas aestuariivivens]